jgi:putative holliday junction resolvase
MTPPGCVLGVDPGERRVGIAAADLETRFARPVEVIDASSSDPVERTAALVVELDAERVVVGRPTGLGGGAGPAVAAQQDFVDRLRARLEVPVEEFDERLTTVIAEQGLRASGAGRRARKRTLDAIAAQVMLQGYMDARR